MNHEQLREEIVDLGVATVETKGVNPGDINDTPLPNRAPPGLSDD